MGFTSKNYHASRSFHQTAAVPRTRLSNNFRAVFQRFFQSGEGPVMFVMKRKPSDVIMCRGAYGLSFVGIFISCYGVYLMVHDKNTKKELKP